MGRKPIERKYIKPTDKRKNNGRKKGDTYKKPARTSGAVTKAKKARIRSYAVKAMEDVFGSQAEAMTSLAQQAKDGSFPHMKLLLEYGFGKPEDLVVSDGKGSGATFNIQNIFTGSEEVKDKTEESDYTIIDE